MFNPGIVFTHNQLQTECVYCTVLTVYLMKLLGVIAILLSVSGRGGHFIWEGGGGVEPENNFSNLFTISLPCIEMTALLGYLNLQGSVTL